MNHLSFPRTLQRFSPYHTEKGPLGLDLLDRSPCTHAILLLFLKLRKHRFLSNQDVITFVDDLILNMIEFAWVVTITLNDHSVKAKLLPIRDTLALDCNHFPLSILCLLLSDRHRVTLVGDKPLHDWF